MIERPRIYLDANIFIAAFEAGHSGAFDVFASAKPALVRPLCTSVLTKAELLVKPLREGNDQLVELYENWSLSNDILEVGDMDGSVARYAAVLRSQYRWLKLPDAVHLSTALGFECTHFLSFDQDLERVKEITNTRWGISRSKPMPTYLSPADPGFQSVLAKVAE